MVALIVTIIVLVILAAVTIKSLYDSKFINTAMEGTVNYAEEQGQEVVILQNVSDKLDYTANRIENLGIGEDNSQEEPKKLAKPQVEVVEVTNYSFQIKVTNDYEIETQFEYYVNGIKQGERTSKKIYNVENLAVNTEYEIKVIVYKGEEQEETEISAKTDCKNILMLFDNGEQFNSTTGGWTGFYINDGTNPSVGKTEVNELLTVHTWGIWCAYALATKNKIDVTSYTNIVYEIYSDETVYQSGYDAWGMGYSTGISRKCE